MRNRILNAARAESIPEGAAGLWHIKKIRLARSITAPKDGKLVTVPAGEYTQLWRWTNGTIQDRLDGKQTEPGELVMTDSPDELNTHLNFMLRAYGRVLITGLGLVTIGGAQEVPVFENPSYGPPLKIFAATVQEDFATENPS